jgi:methanethiol S-methyltransferase
MRFAYLMLALLWTAYCAVHSVLISIKVTSFFKRVLGTRYCFYRLLFNAFSLGTLLLLLTYSHSPRFQGLLLLAWNGNCRIVQYVLLLVALVLLFSGARHYSMSQFLGVQQIRSNRTQSSLTKSGHLDTTGVLGFTRHPWYLATFILLWAGDQNAGSVIINAVLSGYLVIGTLLEERKLVLEFGDKYREYQENVSMFVPLKWLNHKNR